MFAAAATFVEMAFNASLAAARWLATKALMVSLLAIVLPWVLKGFFIWGFDYFMTYGREIAGYLMNQLSTMTAGSYDIHIPLSGVGGYLAIQTGLIDYSSIIFTGWGIYWFIAVLPRGRML